TIRHRTKGRFGDDLRTRRASHRLRRNERAHRRAHGRSSRQSSDGLHRCRNWRRLEVGARRDHLQADLRPAPRATDCPNQHRSAYKTTNGGQTWIKILKGSNPSTGCSMMSMDSKNPKTVYAGMWDFRRKGWTFRSGGDGETAPSASGLFKSTDGGATWTDLNASTAKGLPAKPWGRIAVTVAPSNPNVVYAFIEAVPPKNALYRSSDGGRTWEMRDRSQAMIWRPFYFANLIVDPKDENRVFKPDGPLVVSSDGGQSFSGISNGAHGDFHDLWIDPTSTDRVITGDDGGVWYSY